MASWSGQLASWGGMLLLMTITQGRWWCDEDDDDSWKKQWRWEKCDKIILLWSFNACNVISVEILTCLQRVWFVVFFFLLFLHWLSNLLHMPLSAFCLCHDSVVIKAQSENLSTQTTFFASRSKSPLGSCCKHWKLWNSLSYMHASFHCHHYPLLLLSHVITFLLSSSPHNASWPTWEHLLWQPIHTSGTTCTVATATEQWHSV